jgi:hypothetical protein
MKAYSNSGNNLVSLFFAIGASRGKDITPAFEKAYQEDPIIATKIALWARDVRGGAGERKIFRDILVYMEENHPEMLEKIIPHIPEYGRFDDGFVFKTTNFKNKYFSLVENALKEGNKLCAKFCPREKSSKKDLAIELRQFMKLSPKQYRKLLVNNTQVVETPMCAKQFDTINFGHVPSVAAARYQKAFNKNAPVKYAEYKASLVSGTGKVNASAIFPHDVIVGMRNGDKDVAIAQWDALPNFMTGGNILMITDVSGSMSCSVGGNPNLRCMDVSIALGLYCADKNTGPFKDVVLTFSEDSRIEVLKGNLYEKYNQLQRMHWGMSTNLNSAFDAILKVGIDNKLSDDDMPKYVIVCSDMQFNSSTSGGYNESAMQMISRKYKEANFTVPKLVWWNLNDHGNVPVRFDQNNVGLVSGFSPSILKNILSATEFTPYSIMMSTIDTPRYDIVLS